MLTEPLVTLNSMNRLIKFLEHVAYFPVPLRAASVVSGISENNVRTIVEGFQEYEIRGEEIFLPVEHQIPLWNRMLWGDITVEEARWLNQEHGFVFPFRDGKPLSIGVQKEA